MKVKKMLALLLTLMLVFGSFSSVSAMPDPKELGVSEEAVISFDNDSLAADPRLEGMTDDAEVRIIVELKGKPAINYATEKGVKVNKMDKRLLQSITTTIKNSQAKLKQDIQRNNIKIKYHRNFVTVANGFSGTTTLGEAKKIEKLANVERVVVANEYERPVPDMNTSKDIISTIQTWDLGYKGDGMVISIIDSGIDPTHKDMKLTDSTKAALSQTAVAGIVAANNLSGRWYTDKVPYGFNYYDQNDIVADLGPAASMHGMHVAGTAGANGDEGTGIKGVAPEAQLLAMKVFSNDPNFASTYADIYISAIEDSIILGADVMNMSLGSVASFVRPNDPEQMALTRASQNGIMLAASSGNSGHIGYGFTQLPYAKNPDIGVVGAPGLNANSIQTASIENSHVNADALTYKDGLMGYMQGGSPSPHPYGVLTGQVEYVFCKLGLIGVENGVAVDDFEGVDVAGKIALIQRGGYTSIPGNFVDKIMNAQNKGAIGVIVFNSTAGGDALMSMAYPPAGKIPAIFIGLSDGNNLKALIETGENFVSFGNEKKTVVNPNAGKMAESSSWGTTPNLEIKPEITAPGVNIYSTFNDNSYGNMSGTSMASPHVAGGSALIFQRVDKEFGLTGLARQTMAKNLLLSTAEPLRDKGTYNAYYKLGNYTSPRRIGAGVMNLYAAASTPSIVVDKSTGISKVNMKEIGDVSTFTLKVTNFSDSPVIYNVTGTVGTDLVLSGRNRAETQGIYKTGTTSESPTGEGQFPIIFSQNGQEVTSIEVPAKGEIEFNVTIDLNNTEVWANGQTVAANFPNGAFVEGFVRLTAANDNAPTIGVPYMGFYGKWDKAPIIDDTNYKTDAAPYYGGYTVMSWLDNGTYRFLGYTLTGRDMTKIAFSPNGDGQADKARLLATFLRNASELQINILNKDGRLLRTVSKEYDVRKNYYNAGRGAMYTSNNSWEWDGKINNRIAADGEYIYQVKAKVDYPNAQWQTVEFPIRIDTAAPAVNVAFDKAAMQLKATASDNHAIKQYELLKDGIIIDANETGVFDLAAYTEGKHSFQVKVHDFAWNVTTVDYEVVMINDTTKPVIYVESPGMMDIYAVDKALAKGYVTDDTEIREIKVNDQVVPFTFDETTKQYHFEKELTLVDGGQHVKFEAIDIAGNSMSILRKIFIDTKAPVVNVTLPETVDMNVDHIAVTGTVTDNMPGLTVKINDNMVYNSNASWLYITGESPISYDIESFDVALELGENIIVVEAIDDAGHATVQEYKVFRKTEPALAISNIQVQPTDKISASNPVTVSAAANYEADWKVAIIDPNGNVVKTFEETAKAAFTGTWAPENNSLPNGIYIVEIKAIKGSETVTEKVTFIVENVMPSLAIVNLNMNSTEKISVSNPLKVNAVANQSADWVLTITNSKGVVVETITKQGVAVFEATWMPNASNSVNGTYTVELKAMKGDQMAAAPAISILVNNKTNPPVKVPKTR